MFDLILILILLFLLTFLFLIIFQTDFCCETGFQDRLLFYVGVGVVLVVVLAPPETLAVFLDVSCGCRCSSGCYLG